MPQGTRKQDPKYGDWSGTRRSMTYGQLPKRPELLKAFKEEVGDGYFKIRNDPLVDNEDLSFEAFHSLLKKLVKRWEDGNEDAGNLASSMLTVLGFEWI